MQWDGKSCGQGPGYAAKRWFSNRVSRKPDDIPSRGLLQRLARAAPRDDNIVRFLLVKCEQAWKSCLHNAQTMQVCIHTARARVDITCSPRAERGSPQAWSLRKGA
eukprot:scaffold11421_cov67-Phaeocystis_antarctica.AAC.13